MKHPVTKEVFEALEYGLNSYDKKDLLNLKGYFQHKLAPLNDLENYELAQYLFEGYELENADKEAIDKIQKCLERGDSLGHIIGNVYGYSVFEHDEKMKKLWNDAEYAISKVSCRLKEEYKIES